MNLNVGTVEPYYINSDKIKNANAVYSHTYLHSNKKKMMATPNTSNKEKTKSHSTKLPSY